MHANHFIWGKNDTTRETCPSVLIRTLGIKTLKSMEVNLYWNALPMHYQCIGMQHYQKRVFWVFLCFLRTKTLKYMQNVAYREAE